MGVGGWEEKPVVINWKVVLPFYHVVTTTSGQTSLVLFINFSRKRTYIDPAGKVV